MINFPSSPVNGQVHTAGGVSWIFNSSKNAWETSMGGTLPAHTHTFASLTGIPTTIAGYGITDFNSLGDARWAAIAHIHSFASLTGKPTTIAGYGITDFNSLGDARWAAIAHTHSFSSLTGKPTTLAGYGITDGASADPGELKMIAHSTVPSGWLTCDGLAISRSTFAALFAAIGTTWGAGNGSTTFNVPDLRGRTPVGFGTGLVTETQAAANFNVSDVITVNSNPMAIKPKWLTGMPVQVSTDGVLPTGLLAATTYFVRRLSATTISLYDTLANAMDRNNVTGRKNITATGSGNHTLTSTMTARAVGEVFGVELSADTPLHRHGIDGNISGSGGNIGSGSAGTVTQSFGDAEGITNMQPSAVVQYIIKT